MPRIRINPGGSSSGATNSTARRSTGRSGTSTSATASINYDANHWITGWGNNELQYYTREPDNAFVKDGNAAHPGDQGIVSRAAAIPRPDSRRGSATAVRCSTKKYGQFEFRAKLPTGQGVWPALWMLPQDDKYGGWAASGEIDVLEARGQEPAQGARHAALRLRWPANAHAGNEYSFPRTATIADFHVYALEWEPGEIRWSVDGKILRHADRSGGAASKTDGEKGVQPAKEADLNPWPAPFDQPFYLVMNVAVGGNFLGNPDTTTKFPAEMLVDYVRVYDKVGGYGKPKPRGDGKLPFEK